MLHRMGMVNSKHEIYAESLSLVKTIAIHFLFRQKYEQRWDESVKFVKFDTVLCYS